jgi:[acyl-carrier-protein] S-malonyltransferase
MTDIAFVFPGQGSQEVGMGKALIECYPAARQLFEQADEILGFALSQLCFAGPEAELNDTFNTQAAIFVTSMAALAALRSAGYGVKPRYVAGHSLGEFSAYVAAGALSFADGLRLVRERGRLMKKAGEINPGSMAAILKLEDEVVLKICQDVTAEGQGTLQLANYNSPGQVVISGQVAAVERGIELAVAAKAKRAVKLPISIASHSELMRVIAAEFRDAINNTPLNLPEIPIVANINAEPINTIDAIRAEMEGQLTSSVRWTGSVRWMAAHGATCFVEIGPKNVLTGLIRRIEPDAGIVNISTPGEIDNFIAQAG